jgi:hypothetical protein
MPARVAGIHVFSRIGQWTCRKSGKAGLRHEPGHDDE